MASAPEPSGRELLRAAFAHSTPARLPIDLGATRSSGINALAYARLREQLLASGDLAPQQGHLAKGGASVRVFDVRQYLALVDNDVADWAGVAAAPLYPLRPAAGLRIDSWRCGRMPGLVECLVPADYAPRLNSDGSAELLDEDDIPRYRRPGGGLYYEDVNPRYAAVDDPAYFERIQPSPPSADATAWSSGEAARLAGTRKAVVVTTPFSFFERGMKDFGYDQWLVLLLTEPKLVDSYLEMLLQEYVAWIDELAPFFERVADVVLFSDDVGMQNGPLISPSANRERILPKQRELIEYVKRRLPAVKALLHSCGSVRSFIPDWIDAGFDAINPVQFRAADMDPAELKREFGREIVFWGGGVDTQQTLVHGTNDQIADEARRMVDVLAVDGGYVFAAVHNIQADVSADRIAALFHAVAP